MDRYEEIRDLVESGVPLYKAIKSCGYEHPKIYFDSLTEKKKKELNGYNEIRKNYLGKEKWALAVYIDIDEFFKDQDKIYGEL